MTKRRILSFACFLVAGAMLAAPASARSAKKAKGSTSQEAWYAQAAPCLSAIDCSVLPVATPYPEDTLHVAISAGQEMARTYLGLDFDLPRKGRLTGGTLKLPLDVDPSHGSVTPETASMVACLTTHKFKPVRGSLEAPPEVKCDVRKMALYDEKDAVFKVDLERFAKAWQKKRAALAIVPSTTALASSQTWHVVFPATKKNDKKATGISARLTYTLRPKEATGGLGLGDHKDPAPIEVKPNSGSAAVDVGTSLGGGAGFPTLASESSAPQPTTPTEIVDPEPASAVVAQPYPEGFAGDGFAYPVVWAFPLALLAGLWAVGRALTKDLYRRGV
jgi:hypothetical protein